MTHRRSVTHEEITEQLERRAAGTRLLPDRREAIVSKVALRTAHRRVGTPWSDLWTRIAAALLVLVLGVTVLAGLAGGPASTPPSVQASRSTAASVSPASKAPSTRPIDPLSADALVALVGRWEWLGRVVLADVTIEPLSDPVVYDCLRCPVGEIDGVIVSVDAANVERLSAGRARREVSAFRIESNGLETLGPVTPWGEQLAWPVASAATTGLASGSTGRLVVVEGWLVTADPAFANCGPHIDRPMPTGEIEARFGCYANTWVTEGETQPLSLGENGASLQAPERAVTVQRHAYWRYALRPERDDRGLAIPRRGVYLLELLVDEWDGCDDGWGCRGWQVVARLDPVPADPVPSTARPGSAEATLTDLVVRAGSTDPDTDLPPEEARSLVSTARKWLLDPEHGGPGLGDRPLAPFSVERVGGRARVWFHDLGDGRTIMTVIEMEGDRPAALLDVTISDLGTATLLGKWERDQARAIALRETAYGSMPGTRTGDATVVACPDADGLCASVPMLSDEGFEPGIHFADVIVDIGRERVIDEIRKPAEE